VCSSDLEVDIQTGPLSGGALEALRDKKADSYMAALLFCSLAKAAGVPSLPAAGVLVDRNRRTSRHYWAEFWIDGFGWIPLDPALGAGAGPELFNLREDAAAWYFGNLDNQRITFSRGEIILSQMDPRGRTAVHPRSYALQNLWEEAAGGLESYSSLWGDVTITGMYAQ
jgi:transglutaminase-like putative cysteine protease